MNKRLIFESAAIATVLATLMCASALASYPGPDTQSKPKNGLYGSGVRATVTGYYAPGVTPRRYNNVYFLVERWPGEGNGYNGYLWFRFTVDTSVIEYYSSDSYYQASSAVAAYELTAKCWSSFYGHGTSWGPVTTPTAIINAS